MSDLTATHFDDIIVGAGSAGAVLAARLSEDPDRRVVLIEAGPDSHTLTPADRLTNPMTFASALGAWGFTATVASGRKVDYAQGKGVGGGSAVNGALALRGLPEDYDGWAVEGWTWEQLLPRFRRLESDADVRNELHGDGGPLPVRRWSRETLIPLQECFLNAATELGFAWTDDHNDPGSTGIGPFPMNRHGDIRVSTALSYLPAARLRPNLSVVVNARADRVLLADGRAIGVEVSVDSGSLTFSGDRVILSCGALSSPALLSRSGVGPAELLRRLGIACTVDNPAVGANLMDHPGTLIFLAPTRPELCDPTGPAYQLGIRWSSPDGTFNDMLIGLMNYWDVRSDPQLHAAAGVDHVFALTCGVHEPRSRGQLTLASADPAVPPDIDFNLLDAEADERRLMHGLTVLHQLARSDGMRPAVQDLLLVDDALFGDEDALRSYLHASLGTWYHASGTCRMGSSIAAGAVVDARLQVHGVHGLYVVDASVIPTLPRAATNLTVIAIAERAADLLRGRE